MLFFYVLFKLPETEKKYTFNKLYFELRFMRTKQYLSSLNNILNTRYHIIIIYTYIYIVLAESFQCILYYVSTVYNIYLNIFNTCNTRLMIHNMRFSWHSMAEQFSTIKPLHYDVLSTYM